MQRHLTAVDDVAGRRHEGVAVGAVAGEVEAQDAVAVADPLPTAWSLRRDRVVVLAAGAHHELLDVAALGEPLVDVIVAVQHEVDPARVARCFQSLRARALQSTLPAYSPDVCNG